MIIGTLGWVVVGVAAWLVVATVVGVVIGRVIRQRDRQVPRDDPGPADEAPGEAKPGPDHPSHASRRGTPRRR